MFSPQGPSTTSPPAAAARTELSPDQQAFLALLYRTGEPVFAVLDAAQDERLPAFLHACETEHASLYEGPEADQLKSVAPYLVTLPKESKLLRLFFSEGWGKNWGIFLSSSSSAAEVRHHLRRFLMVETQDARKLYFRFYDPRVLRVYLPTCTQEELSAFFGPITRFLVEAEDPATPLEFLPHVRA